MTSLSCQLHVVAFSYKARAGGSSALCGCPYISRGQRSSTAWLLDSRYCCSLGLWRNVGFLPRQWYIYKDNIFFFLQHFSLLARELSRILSPLFFQKGRRTYIFVIRKNKSASVGTVGGILAVLNFSVRCEGLAGGGAH